MLDALAFGEQFQRRVFLGAAEHLVHQLALPSTCREAAERALGDIKQVDVLHHGRIEAVVDKALAVLARGNSVAEGRIFDFLNALCGDLVDAESLKQAARAALPAYAQTKAAGIAPGNVLEQAKQHKQQRNNNQVVPAELLRVPTPADA